MRDARKAKAGKLMPIPNKLVVLTTRKRLERMATDEKFRKQYEEYYQECGDKASALQKKLGAVPPWY